ncbi:MAG TPA: hypothetical protein VF418_14565 [Sphingomonadaceae bacterium]
MVALAFFGSLIQPVFDLVLRSDRLPMLWLFVIGSGGVAALAFLVPRRLTWLASVKPALFFTAWITLSIAITALYADHVRRSKLSAFHPDALFQHSFLRSLREAPREFQFYLHAGALKNCVPYGWSYREMNLYRIPPSAAINVLPREWITRCAIRERA